VEPRTTRPRDAAATRAALLDAARHRFASDGYERASVRRIAADAGVSQALIFRYFGSKDQLFVEALAAATRDLLDGPLAGAPTRILDGILRAPATPGTEHPLMALLRSTGEPRAAERLRQTLVGGVSERLAAMSDRPDADLRADLVAAWLLGIGLLRSVVGKEPLAGAGYDAVQEIFADGVRAVLGAPDVI
jgi:AcrR family transcriptional regulator